MTVSLSADAWAAHLQSEYLDSFIRQSGAAIKFAVPIDGEPAAILERLDHRGENSGYFVANVNADQTRVHMIDQVFFRISSQAPWTQLTEAVIARLARELGYEWPDDGDEPLFERIGRKNGVEPKLALMELRKKISEKVFAEKTLAKDFRVAMTQLAVARLAGGEASRNITAVLLDWLSGRNTLIAPVKPYFIFTRITRANARHMLESLFHWVRFAGADGTLVLFDLARLAQPKNPKDDKVFYSKAAVLDAYEVFRQFIDSIDRMKGCLIVASPDPAFVDETSNRGISAYTALKARVFDEVHDQRLANPMASLVRLHAADGGAQ